MGLTDEQRAELEALRAENVPQKLMQAGPGRGSVVPGFKSGDFLRGDIEDWLAEKYVEEATLRNSTLRWAKIAGWAAIIGVVVTVVVGVAGIGVAIWLAK